MNDPSNTSARTRKQWTLIAVSAAFFYISQIIFLIPILINSDYFGLNTYISACFVKNESKATPFHAAFMILNLIAFSLKWIIEPLKLRMTKNKGFNQLFCFFENQINQNKMIRFNFMLFIAYSVSVHVIIFLSSIFATSDPFDQFTWLFMPSDAKGISKMLYIWPWLLWMYPLIQRFTIYLIRALPDEQQNNGAYTETQPNEKHEDANASAPLTETVLKSINQSRDGKKVKSCTACNSPINIDDDFCNSCGNNAKRCEACNLYYSKKKRVCPLCKTAPCVHCGAMNNEDSLSCVNCKKLWWI